jgi:predicted nucleic acid-binding protein
MLSAVWAMAEERLEEWRKEVHERHDRVEFPVLESDIHDAEFYGKVEADIEAGRIVIVVADGDIGQTTETEFKEAEEQCRARLATDDEIAEHRERVRVLLELTESTRPSSPLSS